MRKVYTTTGRKKRLTDEALANMRKARALIDPALLEKARQAIAGRSTPADPPPRPDGSIPVDRARTMAIVKKYMALRESRGDGSAP